jgi:hypothetical protein
VSDRWLWLLAGLRRISTLPARRYRFIELEFLPILVSLDICARLNQRSFPGYDDILNVFSDPRPTIVSAG